MPKFIFGEFDSKFHLAVIQLLIWKFISIRQLKRDGNNSFKFCVHYWYVLNNYIMFSAYSYDGNHLIGIENIALILENDISHQLLLNRL